MVVLESWPFASAGTGNDGSVPSEDRWSEFGQALLEDGVIAYSAFDLFGTYSQNLVPFGDSSGLQVKVGNGRIFLKGHFGKLTTQTTIPVTSNATGNPRIDTLVARLNKGTGVKNIEIVVIAGTAAVSPVAPTLSYTSTIMEMPLANIAVSAGASNISAGDVTDLRQFLQPRRPMRYVTVKLAASTNGHVGFGVASSAHPATGRYTCVWTTPFLSTNYRISATAQGGSAMHAVVHEGTVTELGCEFRVYNDSGALVDANWVHIEAKEEHA